MKSLLTKLFKKRCPFEVGDMVYPKEQFSNLYYLFPKGAKKVIDIRDSCIEEGWFVINVGTWRKENWIHAKALKKA